MPLRDHALPALAASLPELQVEVGPSERPFARILAPSPLLGALELYDDDDELTVYAGTLTHGHYNPSDSSMGEDERGAWIAEELVTFLNAVIEDRVLFWAEATGRSGGWEVFPPGASPQRPLPPNAVATLWSKPWVNTYAP